ncbi:hypothetical protein [Desertimonas flava]|uniref:hypothetical protein n=1 Tax=Desertimonas flava TaxID=2064846 RepID=UPI0013C3FB5A|nr:hypothetical protein [Desertimonas flava]
MTYEMFEAAEAFRFPDVEAQQRVVDELRASLAAAVGDVAGKLMLELGVRARAAHVAAAHLVPHAVARDRMDACRVAISFVAVDDRELAERYLQWCSSGRLDATRPARMLIDRSKLPPHLRARLDSHPSADG